MNTYILCPANRITGGVELTHQLCFTINEYTDSDAFMWYTDIDNPTVDSCVLDIKAPQDYSKYKTQCVHNFFEMDKDSNVIVIPEGLTGYIPLFKHAKIVMWWMSVDNYISSTRENNLDELKSNVALHMFQSYYSKNYVLNKMPGVRWIFLSDYINDDHGKFIYPAEYRQNMALFNPKKGYSDIMPLIKKADWLRWIPLINMDREKMIFFMQSGKIYVDFGNHPGKDRIPREAAANGCCVITNKKGSAGYYEDVPIPDKYKFSSPEESLDNIDKLLHDICNDFKTHQEEFAPYREFIKKEKELFIEGVIHFIDLVKKL